MKVDPPTHTEAPEGANQAALDLESKGDLPFVGRKAELDYLHAFVRGALAADRLSALWIQGEAGIGKSRLINQVAEDLYPATTLIRCRFYPDANLSIQSVLASAVLDAARHHGISTGLTLPSTLPTILAEIRGIIRRYPTILVFEDVHLIDEETAREFASIVHGLEHEPTGLICTTRPSNGQVYGLILPFLTTTLTLNPLGLEDLAELGTYFGYRKDQFPNLLRLVLEKTHGFPLAVWSIFRRIQTDPKGFARHPLRETRKIARDLSSSILKSMSRGITEDDLVKARHLSILGEIFSIRAAAILVDNAEEVISTLRHAGFLSPVSGTPTPIVGIASVDPPWQDWLYRFSHSLLHDTLVEEAPEADERLLALLESDIPIYSTLPFTHALDAEKIVDQRENLDRLLKRQRKIVSELTASPSWSAGVRVYRSTEKLLEDHKERLTTEEYRAHRYEMLLLECQLFNAFTTRPEFQRPLIELLDMTENPENETEALQRMEVLGYGLFRKSATWQLRAEETLTETLTLIDRFPELLTHAKYIGLLRQLGGAIRSSNSPEATRTFRDMISAVLDRATETGDRRAEIRTLHDVAPAILPSFFTEEELEDRRALADKIMRSFRNEEPSGDILATWVRFLESTGQAGEANESLLRWMPSILSGYDISVEVGLRLQQLNVDGALGLPIDQIARRARQIVTEFENLQPPQKGDNTPSFARVAVAMHLVLVGMMRGNVRRGYQLAVETCNGVEESIDGYMVLERSALIGDLEKLRQIAADHLPSRLFPNVLAYLREKNGTTREAASREIIEILQQPVLKRQNILSTMVAIALIDLLSGEWGGLGEEEREAVRRGLRNGLKWLGERDAPGYAEVFAGSAREHLASEEIDLLLQAKKVTQPGKKREPEATVVDLDTRSGRVSADGEPALYVEVLGSFATKKQGEKRKGVRGARMKRFIGMLAAQEVLATELSLPQFRFGATEIEEGEESANYLRILTSRLRKSIGSEMILTDGEHPPRLNRALVTVDIVEVTAAITRAISAAAQNNGAAATALLENAVAMIDNRSAFPDQEGEFFDAARDELRDLFRKAINDTVDLLRREGSDDQATELLELTRG